MGKINSTALADALQAHDAEKRRQRGIVNAIARRHGVVVSPEAMNVLLRLEDDPVEIIGQIIEGLAKVPAVLVIEDLRRAA